MSFNFRFILILLLSLQVACTTVVKGKAFQPNKEVEVQTSFASNTFKQDGEYVDPIGSMKALKDSPSAKKEFEKFESDQKHVMSALAITWLLWVASLIPSSAEDRVGVFLAAVLPYGYALIANSNANSHLRKSVEDYNKDLGLNKNPPVSQLFKFEF